MARVKKDEAAAQAAEAAEEQHMQEVDAERRLAILRGEVPPPLPEVDEARETQVHDRDSREPRRSAKQKKRKRLDENDTDFEFRLANERNEPSAGQPTRTHNASSSAPITDRSGHIDLLGDTRLRGRLERNEEAEREASKRKRELEDQHMMRFSNAAGRDGVQYPWYSKPGAIDVQDTGRDVWGNEDSGRKDRDAQRLMSNDPLAMMKQGASQVRMLKKERQRFREERHDELRQLRKEQSRRTPRNEAERNSAYEDRSSSGQDRKRRSSHMEHRDRSSERRRRRHGGGDEERQRRRRRSYSPNRSRRRSGHETRQAT